MTGTKVPAVPWWASLIAVTLAVILIVKHVQWLLFLPVVLFALWETAYNLQQALRVLGGHPGDRLGTPWLVGTAILGGALAVSGWWLLTLAYAGAATVRWQARGSSGR